MENVEVKMLSAEQARLIAEPKEKSLKDLMYSIEYWAKRGDEKVSVNPKEFYLTQEVIDKLVELGYTVTPARDYYQWIDISWKKP